MPMVCWSRRRCASMMPRASPSVQLRANQRKESAIAFLEAAVAYSAKLGIPVERVVTDNGSCYRSKTFHAVCRPLGIRAPEPEHLN
jgi:transposase InsO family protein